MTKKQLARFDVADLLADFLWFRAGSKAMLVTSCLDRDSKASTITSTTVVGQKLP